MTCQFCRANKQEESIFCTREEVPAPSGEKEKKPVEVEKPASTFDFAINSHESAEAALLMLGNLLGYDTYTPDAGRTYYEQKLGEIATLTELA